MPIQSSGNAPKNSDQDCAICHDPLLVPSTISDEPSFIIDDVELQCKHHFHWACLLEYALTSTDARARCALCRQSVLDTNRRFFVRVGNEGGFVGTMDFEKEVEEHLFYQEHPEEGRKISFLNLMSQMECSDAELYLKGEDPGATGKLDPNVCYDTGGMTAMHMAAINDDAEGVQLLLKYGADKDLKTEDGETALDMAREQNAENVIALLTAKPS